MDLSYSAEYEAFRSEVRTFLEEEWTKKGGGSNAPSDDAALMGRVQVDEESTQFRLKAIERGYLYRNVPKRYGGGEQPWDPLKEIIIAEEFQKAQAPTEVLGNGPNLLVPTLLERGSEDEG